jgi:hypothetical protein
MFKILSNNGFSDRTLYKYYGIWAVSRKRMGKNITTERLIPGNQLITEDGFHGYGN